MCDIYKIIMKNMYSSSSVVLNKDKQGKPLKKPSSDNVGTDSEGEELSK